MSRRPPALLDPLRARVRRLQLIVGIGFLSLVVGSITTAALSAKITPRIEGLESGWLRFTLSMLVAGVWAYAVLPLFCYGAARILDLRPWSTAIGAAVTGELFTLAIFFVTGALSTTDSALRLLIPRMVLLAAGVVISAWAVRRARADAAGQEAKAKAAAVAKKDEYAEFTREAERIAAMHDAPKASPIGGAGGGAEGAAGERSAAAGQVDPLAAATTPGSAPAPEGNAAAVGGGESVQSAEGHGLDSSALKEEK